MQGSSIDVPGEVGHIGGCVACLHAADLAVEHELGAVPGIGDLVGSRRWDCGVSRLESLKTYGLRGAAVGLRTTAGRSRQAAAGEIGVGIELKTPYLSAGFDRLVAMLAALNDDSTTE